MLISAVHEAIATPSQEIRKHYEMVMACGNQHSRICCRFRFAFTHLSDNNVFSNPSFSNGLNRLTDTSIASIYAYVYGPYTYTLTEFEYGSIFLFPTSSLDDPDWMSEKLAGGHFKSASIYGQRQIRLCDHMTRHTASVIIAAKTFRLNMIV